MLALLDRARLGRHVLRINCTNVIQCCLYGAQALCFVVLFAGRLPNAFFLSYMNILLSSGKQDDFFVPLVSSFL